MTLINYLFVPKCMDKRLCENFDEYFNLLRHSKNTRGNNMLHKLPSVKLEFARKGFYFFGAKVYKEPPNKVWQIDDFEKFKIALKDHLL